MTSRFQGENGCCLIFPTTEKLMYGSREIPNLTWRMYHRISFKDGTADVYIYEGTADKYF